MNATKTPGTGLPANIVYYCKDCRALREVVRDGHRYVYMCASCGTKNVAFGTLRSIKGYYRLKEDDLEVMPATAPEADTEPAEENQKED